MEPSIGDPESPKDILSWPIFFKNKRWARHHPLVCDYVTYDQVTKGWRLRTAAEVQKLPEASRTRAMTEIAALRMGSAWEASRIGNNLQAIDLPIHGPHQVLTPTRIFLAETPVEEVNTRKLRMWKRDKENDQITADLEGRKVGEICQIPAEIWKIVHHPIKPFHLQELHYKIVFNALPLASRTRFFTNDDRCYACTEQQDIEHFVSSCWTAQVIWAQLQQLDNHLHHTSNWPASTSDHVFGVSSLAGLSCRLKRRLLLHGVALETLWLSYTGWWFENKVPSRNSLINMFRKRIRRILAVFEEQAEARGSRENFQDLWRPICSFLNE
jgi:hypothetical protein